MNSLVYLYKQTIKNRIKKALKKPISYVFVIGIALYIVFGFSGINEIIKMFHLNTSENYSIILSIVIFFLLPANIISYSKRKGLLFRPSEVHFVFSAPFTPKQVLIFAGVKSFATNIIFGIIILTLGLIIFEVSFLSIFTYFLSFVVLETFMESSLIIICYGNETLPEIVFKILNKLLYLMMAVFVCVAGYLMYTKGVSFEVVKDYLELPVIQIIPIIGWNIAIIRLLFVGATTLNVVCSILYVASAILLFVIAKKMKCSGEYYEDAMKFADNYEELRQRKKSGEISGNKKRRFKKAEIEYKGNNAKAIYYRQLLEYKKTRYFIFGLPTVMSLAAGIGIAIFAYYTDIMKEFGEFRIFVIPGMMAYLLFCFSAYKTKWAKELENPYTYLIPDSNVKKIWYATKMEHIRSFVDGMLFTLPAVYFLKLNVLQTVLIILFYICLSANKLYYNMLSDAIIGTLLGQAGRSILKLLMQGIVIGIAGIFAVIAGAFFGVEAGFAVMIFITFVLTVLGAIFASLSFDRMESYN